MQPKLARMLARMFDGMLSSAFLATRGLGATTGKGPDFPNKSALDAAIDAARTLARLRILVNALHPGLCPFRWTATELACCLSAAKSGFDVQNFRPSYVLVPADRFLRPHG